VIFAALMRYLASDALRAGRWVGPGVLFLIVTVSGTAVGGSALGGYGLTATAVFPVAVWLTVIVLNSEDPVQAQITTAVVGSPLAVRSAKLAVSFLACQLLTGVGVGWPLLTGHPASAGEVLAGTVGHALTSLAGVAFGSLLGRPVVRTPGWAVLIGVAGFLVEVLVPGFPPVRPIAVAFSDASEVSTSLIRLLAVVALETVVGAAVLVGLGHVWAQRRT
jgi:hypothetical protein